jgi:phospholipid/cholesterol/gamma-HCH transport system substrate-binding protein
LNKQVETEIKVGIFVSIGLGLIMLAILVLGGNENLTVRKSRFTAHFPDIEGLIPGAKVVVGGIQIGTVDKVAFDDEQHNIRVGFNVARSSAEWIRKDATAEIATQGVLGDKFVLIKPGTKEQPALPDGSDIPSSPAQSISQFLSKSDQLVANLNSITTSLDRILKEFQHNGRSEQFFEGLATTSKNLSIASERVNKELEGGLYLKSTLRNLAGILEKVNNGTGTLGALVNDPGLYDDAKALMGGANQNRILRNLVRQTIKESEAKQAEQEKKAAEETKKQGGGAQGGGS